MTRAIRHREINKNSNELLDKLIYVAAILEPLFLYPQAIELFRLKSADTVFLPTWVGINVLIAIWIWYAVVRRQKVLLIYQVLFFIANSLIIVAGVMYGGQWS